MMSLRSRIIQVQCPTLCRHREDQELRMPLDKLANHSVNIVFKRSGKLKIDARKIEYSPAGFVRAYIGVGIKSFLDAVRITAAHVCVNDAQLELVLLRDFKENMLSVYYC
ncbi:hypothetical protein Tco_1173367 [Tanacetum coccineum]